MQDNNNKSFLKDVVDFTGDRLSSFEKSSKKLAPIAYTLISSLFFVFVSVFVKKLEGVGASQILFFRSLISLVINSTLMKVGNYTPYTNDKETHKLLMMRCVIAGFSHYCFYQSMYILDTSDALTIFQTSPFWTAVLAGFILKEKITSFLFVTLICSFSGILLVVKPSFVKDILGIPQSEVTIGDEDRMLGFVYGCTYSFCIAIAMVIIRKLSGNVHNSVVIQYGLISGVMISGADIVYKGHFSTDIYSPNNLLWVFLVALFNLSAQLLYSRAIMLEQATKLAPLTYSQILFGFIIEVTVMHKEINIYSVIGACLIVVGNLQSIKRK